MQGVVYPAVRPKDVAEIDMPLPPLAEQRRIVAEIEKQFTRLDEADHELESARLRSRVLLETARSRVYALAEMATEAHLPVIEIAADEANSITDGPFGSNLKTEHYATSGPRVIRLQNIGNGVFIDQESHISEAHFAKLLKHAVSPRDVVFAILGYPLPRACVIPERVGPAIVKADCIRLRVNLARALPEFVAALLNSKQVRDSAKSIVHGLGRPRLSLSQMKELKLPIPTLARQKTLIAEHDLIVSQCESTDSICFHALAHSRRLRQSILSKAFSGQLVPQDPNDEPASVLLQRIRAHGQTSAPAPIKSRRIRSRTPPEAALQSN